MKTEREIRDGHAPLARVTVLFRGALRLLRPGAAKAWAEARIAKLISENEAMRRMASAKRERERLVAEAQAEREQALKAAAGAHRFAAHAVYQLRDDYVTFCDVTKADATRSLPEALDRVDKTGMAVLALLKIERGKQLATAAPAALLAEYRAAFTRPHDPASLVTVEVIEALALSNGVRAGDDVQREALRELLDVVTTRRVERLPLDFVDVPELARQIEVLNERADILGVLPIDAWHQLTDEASAARLAVEQLADELAEAGEPSDKDELSARIEQGREAAAAAGAL